MQQERKSELGRIDRANICKPTKLPYILDRVEKSTFSGTAIQLYFSIAGFPHFHRFPVHATGSFSIGVHTGGIRSSAPNMSKPRPITVAALRVAIKC